MHDDRHTAASAENIAAALGAAFVASPLPQWVCASDSLQIVAVNAAAAAQYGYPPDEFARKGMLQLHPADEHDALRQAVGRGMATVPNRVWRHLTSHGVRGVRLALSPVTIGASTMLLVQVLDAVAERGTEDAAAVQEEAVRAATDTAGRLHEAVVATIGHELRQPLTALRAALDVMEQRISRDVGVRARAVMKRQVGALTQLVDDLLDASRVRDGKLVVRREPLDLRTLVAESVAAHTGDLSAQDLHLDTHLPASAVWVNADPVRLHQILSNLLSNAGRHAGPSARVSISVEIVDGRAHLSVRDNGRGIAPTFLSRLFEPFAQAAPGASGGLGIGLFVVRTLVALHDGQITARSDGDGQGAEFIITLPMCAPPPSPSRLFVDDLRAVVEGVRDRAAAGEDLHDLVRHWGAALLLADDEGHIVNASRDALTFTGYADEELRGLKVPDILALDQTSADAHWQRFITDQRQEGLLVLLSKDGVRSPIRYCALAEVRPGLHLSAIDRV